MFGRLFGTSGKCDTSSNHTVQERANTVSPLRAWDVHSVREKVERRRVELRKLSPAATEFFNACLMCSGYWRPDCIEVPKSRLEGWLVETPLIERVPIPDLSGIALTFDDWDVSENSEFFFFRYRDGRQVPVPPPQDINLS